jgi:hypothetical protein
MGADVQSEGYTGREAVLLTRHGKERVIVPALEDALGCRVYHEQGYDTDRLGTFSREVPRAGTQLEAARRKARIGMDLTGLSLGIASEGAFGPDPFTGLIPWNTELVILVDAARELEVVGISQGKACFAHRLESDWQAVADFANGLGFPEQQLILRPAHAEDPRIRKDIDSWSGLESTFHELKGQASNGQVFIETDGRAHANPLRMVNIGLAARNLGARMRSLCPACGSPGFWAIERIGGLPCSDCGQPTRDAMHEVHGCVKCMHRVTRPIPEREFADPAHCDYCNP